MQKRRKIRASLEAWCIDALAPQDFRPAAHHRFLIDRLQDVADGRIKRLMISLPPGSAKSTYGSVLFPAWFMARGNKAVLGASHTSTLAERFSRKIQGFAREFSAVLGYRPATEAAELWNTTNGCEYRAAGVGVGIAGFRADLGIIDDPVKSREDADSETIQEKTWDWYSADFLTRLKPGAPIVLIGTRWHEADLQGRLLSHEADQWTVINIPALAEADDPLGRAPGAALWGDDDYGYGESLRGIKAFYERSGQSRDWTALYQGRPAPEDGDYFKREWLRPVHEVPDVRTMRVYGASDYAVTADGGDYTVHVVAGMDPDGRLFLLDLWRKQSTSDVWVEALCDLVAKWKPLAWAEEGGQIKAAIGPHLERRMRERRAWVMREQFPARADKPTRARSIQARMALDGLHIPATAPWRADLEAELMAFPAGKHDDQVDALGLIGQLLDQMAAGKVPAPVSTKPRDRYAVPLRSSVGSGWAA